MSLEEPLAAITAALEECRALIPAEQARVVLKALQRSYVPPPPGSDRDVLPDRILALIGPWMPPYESTYCQVERALERAVEAHPEAAGELSGWVRRAHDWCRATRKQDMARCVCPRHQAV